MESKAEILAGEWTSGKGIGEGLAIFAIRLEKAPNMRKETAASGGRLRKTAFSYLCDMIDVDKTEKVRAERIEEEIVLYLTCIQRGRMSQELRQGLNGHGMKFVPGCLLWYHMKMPKKAQKNSL